MRERKLDWISIIIPLVGISALGMLFIFVPEQSQIFLERARGFLGDEFGLYYILLGVLIFGATMYMAFSKYGNIKLGNL